MKLMTKEIAKVLPKLGATEGVPMGERKVPLKFFDPCGRYTFYVLEWDGEDTFFGYVVSPLGEDCDEFGYASLAEIAAVRNRLGLGIERDKLWDPKTLLVKAVPKLLEREPAEVAAEESFDAA
jgi:hypothetical protein